MGGDESNFVFGETEKVIIFICVYMHYKHNGCTISMCFIKVFVILCALFEMYGKNVAREKNILRLDVSLYS